MPGHLPTGSTLDSHSAGRASRTTCRQQVTDKPSFLHYLTASTPIFERTVASVCDKRRARADGSLQHSPLSKHQLTVALFKTSKCLWICVCDGRILVYSPGGFRRWLQVPLSMLRFGSSFLSVALEISHPWRTSSEILTIGLACFDAST